MLVAGAFRCSSILLLVVVPVGGCTAPLHSQRPSGASQVTAAEALIDAFYSFDAGRLRSAMASAPDSLPRLLYYQGWAEGGNYVVLERRPCRLETAEEVRCDITVRDDFIAALGTGVDVTDTFHLTFREGRIVSVRNSSNDPPEFQQALEWLGRERPEILEGPCSGFFAGGPTPQDCARAAARGFADFAARRRN
jgi:hypothetical protein